MSVVFSGGYSVDADLTVQPQNTVALAGTAVRLQCTTEQGGSPGQISWVHDPGTTNSEVIVTFNCQPDSSFPQYSVVSSSAGQCDLVINNASLELAATYRCFDTVGLSTDAQLTVIGELLLSSHAGRHAGYCIGYCLFVRLFVPMKFCKSISGVG